MHHKSTRILDTVQRQSPMTLWNSRSDNDILDFALLWAPIGGPTPRNITNVISIDVTEFKHRVRDAVRLEVARLQRGITSSERIYGLSAIAALDRSSRTSTS